MALLCHCKLKIKTVYLPFLLSMNTSKRELVTFYRGLKQFYEVMPRDKDLNKYLHQFNLDEVLNRIYSVGVYTWFLSDMRSGKFLKVGGAFEQMTGYTIEELTKANFIQAARFTTPDELKATLLGAQQFWQYFYSQPAEKRPYIKSSHTYAFIRKNGTTFHALQQSSTVFFDKMGNGVYQFDIITDISHLDPEPKLKFFLLDTSSSENMVHIPLHPGIIYLEEEIPVSKKELEVLKLIAKGKSIKMIADLMGISENTIKHHRTSMFRKCNVNNMAELTAKGLQKGWFKF
jgi:DNA-binding CsgD family transcriptional regulator/PAS domain-containing protein